MITLEEIAKICSVSPMTASRALRSNSKGKVALETKGRILKVAKQFNYRPSAVVRSMQTGRSRLIGYVVPSFTDTFFDSVLSGIQEKLYPEGYDFLNILWTPHVRKGDRLLQSIVDRRVDGVVMVPGDGDKDYEYLIDLQRHGTPVVAIDREIPLNGISFVGSDDIGGAEKLTEYLIGLGHRKICVLTYKHALNLKPVQDRIAGYKNVMARNDLAPMPEIVISPSKRGYEAHQREICNFFSGVSKQDMPTAVFSSSDHVAGDVIIAASDMGIKVPEELSVVGFSDSAVSRFLRPQLTTMHESPFEVGKVSAEIISTLIEAKLAGKPLDQMLPIKRYLSTYLVERESATYVNKNL